MPYTLLPERGIISLSGSDTVEFLQGLISNDVRRLQEGHAVYTALLSPQGKFLHDFFVVLRGGIYYLDVDVSHLQNLLQRLTIYKLRSHVTITEEKKLGVVATWGQGANGIADPRLPELGFRMVGDVAAMEQSCKVQGIQVGNYETHRLTLGVPDGARDMLSDKSLLLEFGFEDLHGVDFNKGCYVGQEVTARSKHRAQLRKFIYQVTSNDVLPPAGIPILLGDVEAGQMRSSSGSIGLALLKVADVDAAEKSNKELRAGEISLKATLPQWVIHKPALE